MNFKRWYDVDVTMSRAVSLWESADENLQTVCADYVIDKLKEAGCQDGDSVSMYDFEFDFIV